MQEGRSVLHWICALGDLGKANVVLSIPGVDVNAQDSSGWTALMIAGTLRNTYPGLLNRILCSFLWERRYCRATFGNPRDRRSLTK